MALNLQALLQGLPAFDPRGISSGTIGTPPFLPDPQMRPGLDALIPQTPAPLPEEPVNDIQVQSPQTVHKGMFGIKGTFRDILGTLGDALSGSDIYRGKRREEKYSDALGEDFLDNPQNALDRLQQAGFGKEAVELSKQIRSNELLKSRYAQEAAYRKAQMAEKGQNIIGKYMSVFNDDASYQQALPRLKAAAEKYGVDTDSLPSVYGEAVKNWGLDPYRKNRLEDFDEAEDLREVNVNDQIRDRQSRLAETTRNNNLRASTSRSNNAARIAAADRRAEITDKRVRGSAGYTGKGGRRPPPGSASDSIPKGTVQRNKKTGATRTWDGSKWVNG